MSTPSSTDAVTKPPHSPEAEHRHHDYVTSRIPWYVHIIWVTFWIIAMVYIARNLIPALRVELPNPP